MSDSNESQLEISLSNESVDNCVDRIRTEQKTGKIYKQYYRKAWEEVPEFKEWLASVPNERSLAYCKICHKTLHAHRLSLIKHTVSLKHTRLAQRKAYEERTLQDEMESSSSPSDNVQILTGPHSGHDYTLVSSQSEEVQSPACQAQASLSNVSSSSLQHDVKITLPVSSGYQKRAVSEKPPITTHVLDISKGVPAAGLAVSLYQLIDGRWTIIKDGHTNGDGRCNTLTTPGSIKPGRYKLHFDTDRYFVMHRQATFFPFVEVVFDVCSPDERNHVPVLLSPYGYQAYRGS